MQRISRRNVIAAIAVVLLWLSFVVTGSHALLTDTATLSGNTLTVGSVGLLISNSQNPSSTIYEESREGFSFEVTPGQAVDRFFLLKNNSTSESTFDIDFMPVITHQGPDLMGQVTLSVVPVDGEGVQLSDATVVGGTLGALAQRHSVVHGTIARGQVQRYRLRTQLAPGYGQSQQSVSYDIVFTGTQKEG